MPSITSRVCSCCFPALSTTPNTGKDWQAKVPASQAAAAYAEHLQNLSDADPLLLLPYVFSMHVPILLGFLGQRIQKTLQLPDDRGLAFFTVSCGLRSNRKGEGKKGGEALQKRGNQDNRTAQETKQKAVQKGRLC